jgi:hypothetical protein
MTADQDHFHRSRDESVFKILRQEAEPQGDCAPTESLEWSAVEINCAALWLSQSGERVLGERLP